MTLASFALAFLKLYLLAIPPSAVVVGWAMWRAERHDDW